LRIRRFTREKEWRHAIQGSAVTATLSQRIDADLRRHPAFGGTGQSGHGREKGFEALIGFSRLKTIVLRHGKPRARPPQPTVRSCS
jgi:acyl-CoA reductase-like NAD-dependent aldehyde dehydrogenase